MCPADPRAAEGPAPDPESPACADLEGLRAAGDVDGLIALARAFRAGTAAGGRDLKMCLEAYRAAASLGSADAAHAVALFHLNGSVVPRDLKEGVTQLRMAADRGSVAAKVYLGNLYELGVHYQADPEKADVWYRSAARAAGTTAEPGSPAWADELAELGCVRYVLARVASAELDEAERARLFARAKANGYGLDARVNASTAPPADTGRATLNDALSNVEAPVGQRPHARSDASASASARAQPPEPALTKQVRCGSARAAATPGAALAAFGYALLFAVTGLGASYLARLAVDELGLARHVPQLVGREHLVAPTVLGLVGILPALLVYRASAFGKAILAGAAMGGVGWVAWGTGQAAFVASRPLQATAFGVAGYLGALLIFGLVGGAKRAT